MPTSHPPPLDGWELGSGSPVLLLHAAPSPTSLFGPLARRLAPDRRVLVPSLPGYGGSPATPSGPDLLDRQQAALLAWLGTRGVDLASGLVVVGFSLGAYRALKLALSGEIEIDALYLLGAFAGLDAADREPRQQLAHALRSGALPQRSAAARALVSGSMLSAGFAAAHPELVAATGDWVLLPSAEVLADEQAAVARLVDLRPRLSELRCPVTARTGALDAATPASLATAIAAAIPHGRLETVAGAGHTLLLEDSGATLDSVQRALVSGPPPRA